MEEALVGVAGAALEEEEAVEAVHPEEIITLEQPLPNRKVYVLLLENMYLPTVRRDQLIR